MKCFEANGGGKADMGNKLLKNSGRACKPDSVRSAALRLCSETIIPLAPASRPGSSDLPEGSHRPVRIRKVPKRNRQAPDRLRVPGKEPGQLSPPIWSCTTRGLPCLQHYC